ncbi:MAG TPA: hypothetical protein VGM92_13355 [Candidatus Kapabacteria bacterium]|jgi:hypothetical protein
MRVRRAALAVFFIFIASSVFAQSAQIVMPEGILHQYPLTDSREVPITTDIGIRALGTYDANALEAQKWIAFGSLSGAHTLIAHLSHDRTDAIFHSATTFAYGERISFAWQPRSSVER